MLIIKENQLTTNVNQTKLLIGEKVVLKTNVIDEEYNQEKLRFNIIAFTYKKYLEWKQAKDNGYSTIWDFTIPVNETFPIMQELVDYDEQLVTSWQSQNQFVKVKLLELGIPEDAIEIVEDIN